MPVNQNLGISTCLALVWLNILGKMHVLLLVRIGKTPNAGKRLFPSSISRISCMSRDLGNSTVNFLHEDPNSKQNSTQVITCVKQVQDK